jgi:hypothetical protein
MAGVRISGWNSLLPVTGTEKREKITGSEPLTL